MMSRQRAAARTASGIALFVSTGIILSGCAGNIGRGGAGPALSKRVVHEGQRVPLGGGRYKIGKPYQIGGKWYYPREDRNYDRVGIASWYGRMFHGRRTANGEVFDMNALTAAHPTLPIPSLVRVTNLENNRTLVVRVNDRGPYKHNRVIDMSRYAAELLGFRNKGVARVRVTYVRPAPLNGDTSYERMVLARQPWMRMAGSRGPRRSQPPRTPRFATNALPSRSQAAGHQNQLWRNRQAQNQRRQIAAAPRLPAYPAYQLGGSPGQRRAEPLFVQAGVYQMRVNAERAANRLRRGGAVRIDPMVVGDRLYYAVRTGPFLSEPQARQGVQFAARSGYFDARIIRSPYELRPSNTRP